jgi:hypothetical protein
MAPDERLVLIRVSDNPEQVPGQLRIWLPGDSGAPRGWRADAALQLLREEATAVRLALNVGHSDLGQG